MLGLSVAPNQALIKIRRLKQSLQIQCINVFIHGNEDMIKQTTCMYQWRMAKCHIKEGKHSNIQELLALPSAPYKCKQ